MDIRIPATEQKGEELGTAKAYHGKTGNSQKKEAWKPITTGARIKAQINSYWYRNKVLMIRSRKCGSKGKFCCRHNPERNDRSKDKTGSIAVMTII